MMHHNWNDWPIHTHEYGWFAGLLWLVILADLILFGVWLWRQIRKQS